MSLMGYFATLCKNTLYNHLTLSKAGDKLDCLPNLFSYATIKKKTDSRQGVMGSFSI